jgi:hypothetical protein
MNSLTQYNAVKGQLRAGDLVMFWGREPLSTIIELYEAGPSHSAIVRQPVTDQGEDAKISQSTRPTILTAGSLNGVQTEPLGVTLAGYGAGATAAALLLSDEARSKVDWEKFYAVIGASDGFVQYDVADLFEFVLRGFPILGAHVGQAEHKTKMVCSSWVTAVLTASGLLTGIDWTKETPQDLVEMAIYSKWIPLLGKPKLSRFDSI